MKSTPKLLSSAFIASLVLAPLAHAQTVQGTIEGTVRDQSAAPLPGATLSARNVNSSATFSAVSDDTGHFRFLILPIGTYTIVAEHDGFDTLRIEAVVVTVGSRIDLQLTLRVAGTTETVVVTAESPLVERTRSQVSTTVDQRLISSLPVNGRSFVDFARLVGGVAPGRGPGFSVMSQRALSLVLMDGVDDHNTYYGLFMGIAPTPYQFSLDAVQEFQVNVNAYSADLGRAANGIVNVITKSGTNVPQGSVFWYFRDDALNAMDLVSRNLGLSKEPLHTQQFGGTAGGPLVKDRLFFFGNYDAQRRYDRNETYLNLPPGFSLSPKPDVAAFQQIALDYLTPRSSPYRRTFDQDILLAKLDWQITPAHQLSSRWNHHRFSGGNLEGSGDQNSAEHTGASDMRDDTVAVSLTSTLSRTMVNVLRYGYVGSNQPSGWNSANPEALVFEGGQAVLTVGRQPFTPREPSSRRTEVSNTLSFMSGRHAFRTGVNVLVDRQTFTTAEYFSGAYRFNSLESFGRSLSGVPAPATGENYTQAFSGEGTPGVRVHPNFVESAVFLQDEWRLRSNLTLNLGARYDVAIFDSPGVRNPVLADAGLDTSAIPTDWNNAAPRLGMAWTPFGSGRLVVRTGFGFFYGRTAAGYAARPAFQNGVTVQARTFRAGTPDAGWIPAYPNTLCGPPSSTGLPPSCPAPITGRETIQLFSGDFQQPLMRQGSAGVEYQLGRHLAVSVTYLFASGRYLHRYRDVNLGAPATPTTIGIKDTDIVLSYSRYTLPRPIAGFDYVFVLDSTGPSTSHGVAVQVTKRLSHGFQLVCAYTWNRAFDENSNQTAPIPGVDNANLLMDSLNPHLDWGTPPPNYPHRLVLNGIWVLPWGRGLPALARAVLTGWEVSGVLTAQSGLSYSARINSDLNNDGNAANDRTPGSIRNGFRMPAILMLDPRLTRTIGLRRRAKLQVIVEAFNVFNRSNIDAVRATQYSVSPSAATCGMAGAPCLVPQSNFGAPTGTMGPRVVQIALRLNF
jgi:hypothetical protein